MYGIDTFLGKIVRIHKISSFFPLGLDEEIYQREYTKLSIKRPVLSNDPVLIFFQKVSIKRPGPSQKKLIILFYFKAATANFWSLLNDLV